MTSLTLLTVVVVGLIAGAIADKTVAEGNGLLTNIFAGIVGAFATLFLVGLIGISVAGTVPTVITAAVGALAFALLVKALSAPDAS